MRPELQGIVEEAARLLDAPITLEDRRFQLVAYGSQRPDVDAVRQESILQRGSSAAVRAWFEGFGIASATGPVLTPADPVHGTAPRLCLPARWRGVTYGYLWAYGRTTVPAPEDVGAAMALAEHAGSWLAAADRRREAAAATLADLLAADADDVGRGVAALLDEGGLRRGTPVVAVVAGREGDDVAVPEWRLPRAVLAATTEAGTTLLVAAGRGPDAMAPARVAANRLLDLQDGGAGPAGAAESRAVAGVGAVVTDLRQLRTSWRTARLAQRVAAAVPERGPVAVWDDLGAYRLLATEPAAGLVVDDPARRLLAEPELARTARVYLDHAGSVAATAAALSVHRQTLYYRLGRIETLTGLSLRDGQDRLRLHLALTLAPLLDPPA